MQALYLSDKLELRELPVPRAGSGQALVKVRMAGICNTDLELIKGYMGFRGVLGHEFVGVVEACETSSWIGERICGEINFGCGTCDYCLRGLSRHCPQRSVLGILNQNGAFAEYVVLPVGNLHLLPDGVSDHQAVFVEPLAAALEILEQVRVAPDDRLAVIGDGKLGLLICQVLRLTGGDVHLIGKHDSKMRLAREWGIATHAVDDLPGEKYDIVVDASGQAGGFQTALELLRPRGTLVLKSTYHGNLNFDAAPLVIDEITVVGSRCGPFPAAIRLLEKHLIDVESLIAATYPFENILQAVAKAGERQTLKVLVDFHA